MLEQTCWIVFVILWHLLWFNELLFHVFVGLLIDFVEASIRRQQLALEVEDEIDIVSIVLFNQVVKIECIENILLC